MLEYIPFIEFVYFVVLIIYVNINNIKHDKWLMKYKFYGMIMIKNFNNNY